MWVFAVLAAIYLSIMISDRKRAKKLFSQVHVQGKTEENEVMDFTISLFEDESQDQWDKKLNTAFALRERRLKFQNDRVLAIMEQAQKENQKQPLKLAEEKNK